MLVHQWNPEKTVSKPHCTSSFCLVVPPVLQSRLEPDARQGEDVEARPDDVSEDDRDEVCHGAAETGRRIAVPPEADHDTRGHRAEAAVYPLRAKVLAEDEARFILLTKIIDAGKLTPVYPRVCGWQE